MRCMFKMRCKYVFKKRCMFKMRCMFRFIECYELVTGSHFIWVISS